MSRLILVSNRVLSLRKAAQAGGAAVAIADVLKTRGGIWFGWNGQVSNDLPSALELGERANAAIVTTPLSPEEHAGYYLGYSNAVLWPAFHGRLDLAAFDAAQYEHYLAVNRRFARLIGPHVAPDDTLWIHDYHLVPLAEELRKLGVTCRIGLFLHIPFPPPQSFQAIPEHAELARMFAAYDLVGLQTRRDVANLVEYLQQEHCSRAVGDGLVELGGRRLAIACFPVGIEPEDFASPTDTGRAANPESSPSDGIIRAVGVDRLDYTKGLPEKLRAFGHFLESNPEYRRRTVLTQIAPPSRDTLLAYKHICAELAQLSGTINGRYGELDWVPVNYINRPLARRKLRDIYRGSRLCLVTPLRDGMNLVAKEFIAAQDAADPGVLVLSRFAGAAEELEEALIVNPHAVAEVSRAIRAGIEMPLAERQDRHRALMSRIRKADAEQWCRRFLDQLDGVDHRRGDTIVTRTATSGMQSRSATPLARKPSIRRSAPGDHSARVPAGPNSDVDRWDLTTGSLRVACNGSGDPTKHYRDRT